MSEPSSAKPKCLSEREMRICRENGIETEHVSVINRREDRVILLNHMTGDEIWIQKGVRRWL